jgi:hypothetical protein
MGEIVEDDDGDSDEEDEAKVTSTFLEIITEEENAAIAELVQELSIDLGGQDDDNDAGDPSPMITLDDLKTDKTLLTIDVSSTETELAIHLADLEKRGSGAVHFLLRFHQLTEPWIVLKTVQLLL